MTVLCIILVDLFELFHIATASAVTSATRSSHRCHWRLGPQQGYPCQDWRDCSADTLHFLQLLAEPYGHNFFNPIVQSSTTSAKCWFLQILKCDWMIRCTATGILFSIAQIQAKSLRREGVVFIRLFFSAPAVSTSFVVRTSRTVFFTIEMIVL